MSAIIELTEEARPFVPVLAPYERALRGAALGTWHARMVNEYCSARVFDALAAQLVSADFSPDLVQACRGFADEERRHGVLCAAVVLALGGEARAARRSEGELPQHEDAPPRAAVLRNVIHVCCMSETVAVSLIGEERERMPAGSLRELLTRIYADEIGHARFGWRLLEALAPTLSRLEREALEAYLPVALRHLEQHELSHLPDVDAPPGGEQLGLCSGREARELFFETVRTLIVPGLRRWFALPTPETA